MPLRNSDEAPDTSTETSYTSLFTKAPAQIAHELQLLTREQRGFGDLEAVLPDHSRSVVKSLVEAVSTASAERSRVTDWLSLLGPHNPLPKPVTSSDSVWLLDNVAYYTTGSIRRQGAWKAEYVVAVMAQRPRCPVVDAVRAVADQLVGAGRATADEATLATIEQRIAPFLQDILPGRRVHGVHGQDWPLVFRPGGRDGVSSDWQTLPASSTAGAVVPTTAQVPAGADGMLRMNTFFAGPDGWGVISDIDDTIKVTQTSDPVGILQTTFVDAPTPVAGMPALFQQLLRRVGAAAPFFYLSASPHTLYPFLRAFRQQHYPHGALLLREATPMSVTGLLSTLTLGTQAYKVERMRKVRAWLPRRKFVCVGDSTQSDPEAYGEIYRAFPGWVRLILIRKVTDIAALGIAAKNEPARFEKAFAGVPRTAWHVFEDPAECDDIVRRVVGDEARPAAG